MPVLVLAFIPIVFAMLNLLLVLVRIDNDEDGVVVDDGGGDDGDGDGDCNDSVDICKNDNIIWRNKHHFNNSHRNSNMATGTPILNANPLPKIPNPMI